MWMGGGCCRCLFLETEHSGWWRFMLKIFMFHTRPSYEQAQHYQASRICHAFFVSWSRKLIRKTQTWMASRSVPYGFPR